MTRPNSIFPDPRTEPVEWRLANLPLLSQVMTQTSAHAKPALRVMCIALLAAEVLFALVSCTKSLDMSAERISRPGTEWGVVIGSVLVQKVRSSQDVKASQSDKAEEEYEFEVVRIQPGDPNGEDPYAEHYRLTAHAGEERVFISRLRSGEFLMRNFHKSGVMGIGGDLNLTFSSMAGEIRYVGRVLVEIPQRPSKGKGYRFTVENSREATLADVVKAHPELVKDVVDSPAKARPVDLP